MEKEIIQEQEIAPRIYIGTYRKYNEGSIQGAWVDLSSFEDYESFEAAAKALHSDEADPEFMIQDFEGFPKALYDESGLPDEETFDRIRAFAENDNKEALEIYLEYSGDNDEAYNTFEEAFQGVYDSEVAFAEQLIEDIYSEALESLPSILQGNIDYKGVAYDLRIGGDYWYHQKDGQTYVFRNV